ncbi:MAG TPA: serine hydrolase [Steroidobacteraceae bacterium]|nr:serine hydrolase [Steroidobacteraceae bacterium]
MRRSLLCAALAAAPLLAFADTPAYGPPDRVLFWTPQQQRVSYPNMDRIFLTREISRGDAKAHPAYPLPVALKDLSGLSFEAGGKRHTLAEYLEHNRVAGLLVIQDGTIAYEHYALGHTASSKWTSFSVAKSLTSMLVGAAIKDGYVKDVNDAVTDYLPVLKGTSYQGVTIRQVLQMSSGVGWNEDYTDPKSDVARIGAVAAQGGSLGLVKYMGALPRVAPAGSKFNYNTGETHLAGAIVRAAVGNNLSSYASQKIWSKFAMESNGFWMLADDYGAEHAGCCMSATLRDYGRIGLLALRKGVLADGSSILPENWMKDATTPSPSMPGYGYQWWIIGPGNYGARGIFGQSIEIYEPQSIVIVTHGLWPTAQSKELSEYRRAFHEAVRDALSR